MSLTVRLSEDDEGKLGQIAAALQMDDRSSVIRALINEKWTSLQPSKSFVERRGGPPQASPARRAESKRSRCEKESYG